MVTSQAVPVPIRRVRAPTPAIRPRVRRQCARQHIGDEMRPGIPARRSAITAMAMIGASAISERMKAADRPAEIAALDEPLEPPAERWARDPLAAASSVFVSAVQ